MEKLEKKKYLSRKDLIQKINIVVLGYYAYYNRPIAFSEMATYLNVTPDRLRMAKMDKELMNDLERCGIYVQVIGKTNHFSLKER